MTSIRNIALDRTIEVSRIIGHIKSEKEGPTIVFFGGIHGNENSGVFALHDVLDHIKENKIPTKGNIYALSGNLPALKKGDRYCSIDLNRVWTRERIENILNGQVNKQHLEVKEQYEIFTLLQNIVRDEKGPFFFMDLHTTSSATAPFVMVNDSLLNRKFTEQYPLPLILGVEEYLDGPLLSYINELGYVSFGYEAGQHDDLSSYENQVAFIFLSMAFAKVLKKKDFDYYRYFQKLAKTTATSRKIYEIYSRYKIHEGDSFTMKPGYVNFQKIRKGQKIATNKKQPVYANYSGRIFMPLYQNQGKEGFFIIRKIRPIFLKLSEILRRTKVDHILPFLPGVRWQSEKRDALIVNLEIARFFARQFLHLLGYRSKKIDKTHLIIKNREAASKFEEYDTQSWKKMNGK
jgi:succinylglutamate desuccinylase